jgi:excinuclease UvrABC ATPase subunit
MENGSWVPKEEKKFDPTLYSAQDDVQNTEDGASSQFIERYKCHHCDKSYKNMRSLNQHFREVQVCRVCKMSLPSVEEFTSHILEDHTVGALCGVCMNSFRSRARLVEHVRTHTQVTIKRPDGSRNKKNTTGKIMLANTPIVKQNWGGVWYAH